MRAKMPPQRVRVPTPRDVPSVLNPEGFYAIEFAQAEMYDLGNLAYIDHFVLYDRKEKIALDITSDVSPAPLLSSTRDADLFPEEAVKSIEGYLTNSLESYYYPTGMEEGVSYFKAKEFSGPEYDAIRARMIQVRDGRKTLDSAIEGLRKETSLLGKKLLPQQNNPLELN